MRAGCFSSWFAGPFFALLAAYTSAAATQVLTVNTNGSGTVNRNPTNTVVPQGAVVTLTAIPSTNWNFGFWSGDASGSTNPLNVTMDRDKTITANFSPIPSYTLTVSVSGQGTVDPPGGSFRSNTIVSVAATPAGGWVFTGWAGDLSGNINPTNITMNANKGITAVFAQPPMIISQPQSVFAGAGDSVTFSVGANGTVPLSYGWQFNGSNVSGATMTNLMLTNVQPANAGGYRAIVSNSGGSVTSQVATLTITNFCSGSNVVTVCSEPELRQAIARGGIVQFCCGGTITITSEIDVTNNVDLRAGEHRVVISGYGFVVATNVTFALSNVWLDKGRIYNNGGIVRLLSCVVSNAAVGNSASLGSTARGPLNNRNGTLSLENVLVISNTVTAGNGYWPVSPFEMAIKGGNGLGGAIFNEGGLVSILRSEFRGNIAMGGNGARHSGAGEASGGAIYNLGVLHIRDSAFSKNEALGGGGSSANGSGNGGAVCNIGTADICDTTFDQNIGRGGRAGSFGSPGATFPGGDANGGAICNRGLLSATNCTLVLNRAEAGGTSGFDQSPQSIAYGGAILSAGTLTAMNITIASNIVVQGFHSPPPQGANVANSSGTFALRNSLVSYGVGVNWTNGSAMVWPNASGTITDGGFNISSDGSCNFMSGASFNFTDPKLGPLANNGGPTLTMRPLADSPAIDFGTADGAPPFDQRGARRPSGGGVDMGAFEIGPIVPILTVQRNGSMLDVSFTAEAGISYQLRSSTNLVTWQLHEAIGSAPANWVVSRSISIIGPRRFFRVQ
jgi:hypothetical protein